MTQHFSHEVPTKQFAGNKMSPLGKYKGDTYLKHHIFQDHIMA